MRRALCLALALPFVVSLAACSGTNPSTDTPATDPSAFQQTVPQGTPVFVNRAGQWLPASVVRQTGAANVLVHYEGMPDEWDEDVAFDRVRSRPAAAPAAADYKAGETVLVTTQNRLLVAEMVQPIDAGTFRIHYAGYGPEAVENVTAERIRRPFAGATAHPVGAAVLVNVGAAQPMPAKVLAVAAADQWIVRFDGQNAQYDQQVGADRIRPAAAAMTPPAPTATAAPTTTTPAATAPTTTAPAAAAKPPEKAPGSFKAGDAVLLLGHGIYAPGKIVGPGAGNGTFRVRVDGQTADEEAQAAQLTQLQEPLKGVKYKAGQAVFVEWHGVYAPGKIVKDADTGNYWVKIEGKGAGPDELVNLKRLRPR